MHLVVWDSSLMLRTSKHKKAMGPGFLRHISGAERVYFQLKEQIHSNYSIHFPPLLKKIQRVAPSVCLVFDNMETEVQEHWHTKDGCKSHQDRCLTAALDLPDLLQRTHRRTVCHGLAKRIQTPPSELLSYLWNSAKCHSSLRNWKGKFTRSHPFFCRFAFALVSEP